MNTILKQLLSPGLGIPEKGALSSESPTCKNMSTRARLVVNTTPGGELHEYT